MPDIGTFNSTMSSGVALNSINGGIALTIFVLFLITTGLVFVLSNLHNYRALMTILLWIYDTMKYTIIGVGASLFALVLYFVCSAVSERAKEIDPAWYAYMIAWFIGLTVVGKIVAMGYERFLQMRTLYRLKEALKESEVKVE